MISIIVMAYKKEKELNNLIKILSSQLKNEEIIIINDGLLNLNYLKSNYPFIKLITHKKNKGPSASRNTGIKNAKFNFVNILAEDYIVPKNYLKNLKTYMCNDVTVFKIKSLKNSYIQNAISSLRDLNDPDHKRVSGAALINKKVFDVTGYFDETLRTGEDVELAKRLLAKNITITKGDLTVFVDEDSFIKNVIKYYGYGAGAAILDVQNKTKKKYFLGIIASFFVAFRQPIYFPIHFVLIVSERLGMYVKYLNLRFK
jgi:glycosyltransferase involved in cell wall biosynthesis